MIDHIGVIVSNLDKSKRFYSKRLKFIGYSIIRSVAFRGRSKRQSPISTYLQGRTFGFMKERQTTHLCTSLFASKSDRWSTRFATRPLLPLVEKTMRAGDTASVQSKLLRRVCLRSRRPQHQSRLPGRGGQPSPLQNTSQQFSGYFNRLGYSLVAQTIISTRVPGVRSTPTAARAGRFFRSTQAIQASFISSFWVMSAK